MNKEIKFKDFKKEPGALLRAQLKGVEKVFKSGWWILGEEVKSFEQNWSKKCRTKNVIGLANGLDAIEIALRAIGIKQGDEVITTAHTAVATASAIYLAGARPIFVDIEPDFFTIDPDLVESAITLKTKAIIPVHIYGQSCNMDAIMEIANKYNLKVIEDSADTLGATINGKSSGYFSDMSITSFYGSHIINCAGNGGALLLNDQSAISKAKLLF